jgi:hypothetical protein
MDNIQLDMSDFKGVINGESACERRGSEILELAVTLLANFGGKNKAGTTTNSKKKKGEVIRQIQLETVHGTRSHE